MPTPIVSTNVLASQFRLSQRRSITRRSADRSLTRSGRALWAAGALVALVVSLPAAQQGGLPVARVAARTQATLNPRATSVPVPAVRVGRSTLPGLYGTMITGAALAQHVDPRLLWGLVHQESDFHPSDVSAVGAEGLTQLMPSTAVSMGVRDRSDPAQSLAGGALYLHLQIKAFHSIPLALAAYNAGPGAVEQCGCVPPYPETRNYVVRVLAYAHSVGYRLR
jgi:soluble lytic murein transglycosylase-like protein